MRMICSSRVRSGAVLFATLCLLGALAQGASQAEKRGRGEQSYQQTVDNIYVINLDAKNTMPRTRHGYRFLGENIGPAGDKEGGCDPNECYSNCYLQGFHGGKCKEDKCFCI